LKEAPGFLDAHYGLSLLMHSRNEFENAFQHALFATNGSPTTPRYLAQLGLCHICVGNYGLAEDILRRALQQSPADKTSWNNLGISLLSKGRTAEARSCFVNALKLSPDFLPARRNLDQLNMDVRETPVVASDASESLIDAGDSPDGSDSPLDLEPQRQTQPPPWHADWNEVRKLVAEDLAPAAFSAAEKLLLRYPDTAELAVLVDRLYRHLGESDSGLSVLQAYLVRHPDSTAAHQAMGGALHHRPDFIGAERHLKKALELGSRDESLLKALARTLMKQDKFAEALVIYQECQDRWPSDMNLALLAMSHHHNCDYAEALEYFSQLQSKNLIERFGVQAVYAHCLSYAGRIEEALAILNEHVARHGSVGQVRLVQAALNLLVENFAPGWDGYRHRQVGLTNYRVLPLPEWQGDALEGKTIVVLAEQGLGDQIMFASCLPDLLALNPARVIVEVISRVAPTIARSFPRCEVIATRQDSKLEWLRDLGEVDCYTPLGELPRLFRRNLQSFPSQPYLKPAPERVAYWRSRLETLGPGPYLGTSWRGGTESTRRAIRTLSPDLLQPLTSAVPAQWISLQYGDVREELAIARAANVHLVHWPEAIADLDEFAALLSALDGVFTVCNTTVHYAGAVGQHTWVLAPIVPEWRYGLYNTRMPWYPHVTVLRQPAPHAWVELIAEARQHLIDNFCQPKPPQVDNC
jgi:Flp pilus assembly protein TadD